MEDFKILFYIAVAIAWVVYKNYQKVQKNRPKRVEPAKNYPEITVKEKEPVKMVLEKIESQKKIITKKQPEKKEFKSIKKAADTKPVLKDQPVKKTPSVTPFLNREANQPKTDLLWESKKDAETVYEIQDDQLFDLKKIDIRTAIIYSEILKRPQL